VASCTATRGGERLADSFKSLTHARLWVAWREETQNGRATKIPKNPATGRNASVPTDPSTYGTRAEAETRGEKIQGALALYSANCLTAGIWSASTSTAAVMPRAERLPTGPR
jgi:hypothetical protein